MRKIAVLIILVLTLIISQNNACESLVMDESRGYPEVVETFPKDNVVDIPVDTRIMAVFTRNMKRSDINEFTVTLNDGVSDLATNVRYNSNLKKAIIIPLEELLPKHVYYVTISRTIRDINGNPMNSDYVFKFKTVTSIVKIPPVISQISPTVGGDDVSTDTNIEMQFSTSMNERTVNEENITLFSGKKKIIGIVRYYPTMMKAVFVPDRQLEPGKVYTVTVKNVKSDRGVPLEFERIWSFRVADESKIIKRDYVKSRTLLKKEQRLRRISERISSKKDGKLLERPSKKGLSRVDNEDMIPGILIEQYPAKDIEMVRTDSNIKIKFSRNMNPHTLTIFNFSLREGNDFIFGKVEYNAKTREAVFIPAGKLKPSTEYTVHLSSKIEDDRGKSIGDKIEWKFKTVSSIATFTSKRNRKKEITADLSAPHTVSVYPKNRAEEIKADTEIYAVFNERLRAFSVNSFTFRVNDGENDIDGKVGYDISLKRAWFKPEKPLESGRIYNVLLTRGIMDKKGLYMQKEKKWKFITGIKWKTSTPRLITLTPKPGTIPLGQEFKIMATFSEKLNRTTVNSENIQVYDGGRKIHGKINVSRDGKTVIFKPSSVLKPGGNYTLHFRKELEGVSGNRIENPLKYVYSFDSKIENMNTASSSIANTKDALLEMKMIESIQNKPVYKDALKKESNFQIAPDEMAARMKKSDKSAAGKVKLRRITEVGENDFMDRKQILNKSVSGMDIALKDDVKLQIEKFLSANEKKNKMLMKKIEKVKDREDIAAFSALASSKPQKDIKNGKLRNYHKELMTQKKSGKFFDDDLKYDVVNKMRSYNQKPEKKNSKKIIYEPTSNLKRNQKYDRGSGSINGASIRNLDNVLGSKPERTVPLKTKGNFPVLPKLNDMMNNPADNLMITAIYPKRGQKKVKTNEIISVSFNQDVDLSTVNGMTFIVTNNEELVDGKVVYNPRMNKVIFRPKSRMKADAQYEITLTNGIKTRDGHSLKPIKWNFVTRT